MKQAAPGTDTTRAGKVLWNSSDGRLSTGTRRRLERGHALFRDEAKLNNVFYNSVFWVVTRSVKCFY